MLYRQQLILILGLTSIFTAQSAWGNTEQIDNVDQQQHKSATEAVKLGLANNAADLLAQSEARVTGVEVIPTESGLELVLKTAADGERLVPLIVPEGNDLVIDILDATFAFSIRNGVTELDPVPGIERITVTQADPNSIQVRITGTEQTPSAEVLAGTDDLVLGITPETATAAEDEQIDIIATGQVEEDSYRVTESNGTATRTNTPLRDIPQSVQVIPRQVIEDQNITRIGDALRNVSGITLQRDFAGSNFRFSSRGFENTRLLRNGVRTGSGGFSLATSPNTIERVEVLKGATSVLYGQSEPGGVINFITKQPEKEASYDLEFRAGNFGFLEPSLDFTGPLTGDEKLTYRLNISYQSDGLFRDFADVELFSIAPVIRYEFNDKTSLTFEYEYLEDDKTFDDGVPIDPTAFIVPRETFVNEPDDFTNDTIHRFFLTLNHRFNDQVRVRSIFGAEISNDELFSFRPFQVGPVPESGDITRLFSEFENTSDTFSWQTDLVTEFETGSVEHELLAGFDLTLANFGGDTVAVFDLSDGSPFPINLFDPIYDEVTPSPDQFTFVGNFNNTEDSVGFYLQDLVTLLPNLKLLVGGRLDFASNENEFENLNGAGSGGFDDEAFSPRVGIVYQPIESISLFGNFTRSFIPNSISSVDGTVIDPERGRQFEVGVKGEFSGITASLALYDINKTNLAIDDTFNPGFSIPIGEVNSQGIELDVAGEIMDGWKIIASGFLNDTEVTEGDDGLPEGDTLRGAAENGASLWTTYEIQGGGLKGLGFGAGLFFVGDIEEELPNDFVIPSYVRADASLFYKQENWQAQVNFQNLFDEDYLESTNDTLSLCPGPPFTVIGSLSLKF